MSEERESYNMTSAILDAAERRQATTEQLAAFGKSVMEWILDTREWWSDATIWDEILPIAVAYGLAQMVRYDPSVHGEEIGAEVEPGEEIAWIDAAMWDGDK